VKTVRIWLLLVMAVLLPIRGAVAAAMLCPMAGPGTQAEVQAMLAMHEEMGHAMAHDGHHQGDGRDPGSPDKCNLCAASCCLTPLAASVPTIAAPLDLTAAALPDHSAPPPSFVSSGPERPPRSI
jgi:hypothetical protein